MGTDEQVIQHLDQIIALLSLAFREPIDVARSQIRRDAVADAILEVAADDWIAAGKLKEMVAGAADVAERTVARRMADLVSVGALTTRGPANSRSYRSTGLL